MIKIIIGEILIIIMSLSMIAIGLKIASTPGAFIAIVGVCLLLISGHELYQLVKK